MKWVVALRIQIAVGIVVWIASAITRIVGRVAWPVHKGSFVSKESAR